MMDIKSIFKGCVDIVTDENGFMTPERFTKKQLAHYKKLNNEMYARAPAGTIAEFFTSADEISFSYTVHKALTPFSDLLTPTFDVYEDDVLVESLPLPNRESDEVLKAKHKCEQSGTKKITVVFPCNAVISVGNFDIGDFEPTENRPRRFLILGDSISQGLLQNTATNNYPFMLRRFFDADILNQSVGGDTMKTNVPDATGFAPTDIIIALGTNDMAFTCDIDETKKDIEKYYDLVQELYPDARKIVVSPPWLADSKTNNGRFQLLLKICEAEEAAAQRRNWLYVDGQKNVPHTRHYFSDEVHPNDLGFAHYSLNLISAVIRGIK